MKACCMVLVAMIGCFSIRGEAADTNATVGAYAPPRVISSARSDGKFRMAAQAELSPSQAKQVLRAASSMLSTNADLLAMCRLEQFALRPTTGGYYVLVGEWCESSSTNRQALIRGKRRFASPRTSL